MMLSSSYAGMAAAMQRLQSDALLPFIMLLRTPTGSGTACC
jgi:hypothetical protein